MEEYISSGGKYSDAVFPECLSCNAFPRNNAEFTTDSLTAHQNCIYTIINTCINV